MNNSETIRLLLVEDNPGDSRLIYEMLSEGMTSRFDLIYADRLSTALDCLDEGKFDIILLDLSLPDSQGIDTFTRIHGNVPHVPIIVLTGLEDDQITNKALRTGAQDYLVKGHINSNLLVRAIHYAIERKRAEESLRESEERFLSAFHQNPTAMTIAKLPDGIWVDVNDSFLEMVEYSRDEVIGGIAIKMDMLSESMGKPEQLELFLHNKEDKEEETIIKTKTGRLLTVMIWSKKVAINGQPHVISMIVDVTERKKVNEERQKIDKLESLGTLAGGIAHDFNNLLTGMLGNISLAKMYIDPKGGGLDLLEEAEKAALQATDLTQQLLTFSRGGAPVKKVITISQIINKSTTFTLHGSNVKPVFSIPNDLWTIEADQGQISQVICNIVKNSDEAMPEGGIIEIAARNVDVVRENSMLKGSGKYIEITVRDKGVGISQENKGRIFDPYFTTKENGNGLGLATCYSIIKNHDGYITMDSRLGSGSTFHIYLPACEEQISKKEAIESQSMFTSQAKILVMDDEESVRLILSRILQKAGYQVVVTPDGSEAIEQYIEARKAGEPFDVVIMDLTVPGGMGGKETMEKLSAIDPEVQGIVSSGYANDPIMADCKKYGFVAVAPKPYSATDIVRTVEDVVQHKNLKVFENCS